MYKSPISIGKFLSEGLPRFEGIETGLHIPSMFCRALSEGLPRFEGIETVLLV